MLLVHFYSVGCGLRGWLLTLRAVLRLWGWLGNAGETTGRSNTESPPPSSTPSSNEAAARPVGCATRDARPVSAVLVLAGLSRASIPIPYWVVARAIERDGAGTLLALLELEAAGVVVSRRFAGGGVLYAIAGEERWRSVWSS